MIHSGMFIASGTIPSLIDNGTLNVTSLQTGFNRVSCLDSLDRTNLACSSFAQFMVALQCKHIATVMPDAVRFGSGITAEETYDPAADIRITLEPLVGFNGIWADSGDSISTCYAGTGALKVIFLY
jgi:hypothetical protein